MKKIILTTAMITTSLLADTSTFSPYVGAIDYGSQATSSFKDKSTIAGFTLNVGNLGYLIETSYSHIASTYKNDAIQDLSQDDFTFVYGEYYKDYMYRVGLHYVKTNDTQLNDGIIAIATLGGYQSYDKDKLSFGIEGYYSYYADGHDESYTTKKSIQIGQVSPYLSYYASINESWGNTFSAKVNYQVAKDYVQDTYTSYEISNTLSYEDVFLTLKAYTGEMRTGVKDGGMSVYNTLDLMKDGYEAKLGYYIDKDTIVSMSYAENIYQEFDQTFLILSEENTNKIAVLNLAYSY